MPLKSFAMVIISGTLLLPGALAQKKEIIQLQRDMALLQDSMRQSMERLAGLEVLLKQNNEKQDKLSAGQAVIERTITNQDESLIQPLTVTSAMVNNLTEQFSTLRGGVEEINNMVVRLREDVRDIKTHLTTLPAPREDGGNSEALSAQGNSLNDGEVIFESGLSDYLRGNLDIARSQFMDYLALYPNYSKAGESQYFLAQTYYAEGDYEEATNQFDLVLKKYPLNKVSPDALFKKGMSLLKLKRRTEAETEFQSVLDRFPDSQMAPHAQAELASLRNSKPSPGL